MEGILCFGGSITFGRGEIPNKSWCGRLKDYFEVKGSHNGVYNLGVPGHTSTDLLKRFDAEAEGRIRIKRPSDKYLILVAIGTNDCKFDGKPENNNPRTTDDQFRKNINELITKAKLHKAKLAFIGLSPVDKARTLPFEET
jgi:lysophospholipase L1-like esterase